MGENSISQLLLLVTAVVSWLRFNEVRDIGRLIIAIPSLSSPISDFFFPWSSQLSPFHFRLVHRSPHTHSFNQVKPKNEVEARVYEVLSHKNWGASTTLMNEIAQDTSDYERCEFGQLGEKLFIGYTSTIRKIIF